MERCRLFLTSKNSQAARKAGQTIAKYFAILETNAEIGKPLEEEPDLRELVIPFGDSGYVALYRYEPKADTVYLLAFRHQKEAGFI